MGHDPSWWSIVGACVLAVVGLADDRASLPAVARLGAQVAVGTVAGFALGGFWAAAAGMLLVPAVVNAVNFMDGINGITSLTMTVWGVSALAVGVASGVGSLIVIGAAAAGGSLGFLPYNAPRARMFLGDVGSYLFGGLAATGVLLAGTRTTSVAVVLAPLALYAADTGFALVRRAVRRESLTQAHREHVYQQLTSGLGFAHLPVAAAVAFLSAFITVVAWALPSTAGAAVIALLLVLYLLSPTMLRAKSARVRGSKS
ncbi:hypothetical protein ACFUC1_06875 [Pedococcus sp. NPDC057267]|uniref:hypothetical protein n=1 Tax=Pedococcus sp. NPDC057267 TaxID=3346077 RepID=UPI0036408860